MNISQKILLQRKKKGISQEDLANALNVSRQAVSKWESSQSVPDMDKIVALSSYFNITTDYLLKDEIETIDGADNYSSKNVDMQMLNNYFTMSVVAFMLFFQRIELKTDCVFLSMEYLDSLLESI